MNLFSRSTPRFAIDHRSFPFGLDFRSISKAQKWYTFKGKDEAAQHLITFESVVCTVYVMHFTNKRINQLPPCSFAPAAGGGIGKWSPVLAFLNSSPSTITRTYLWLLRLVIRNYRYANAVLSATSRYRKPRTLLFWINYRLMIFNRIVVGFMCLQLLMGVHKSASKHPRSWKSTALNSFIWFQVIRGSVLCCWPMDAPIPTH